MSNTSQHQGQIRVAFITSEISHFEVPLFRICGTLRQIDSCVFYLQPVEPAGQYDSEYGQEIHWGEALLAGYASVKCESAKELYGRVVDWKPDVAIVYGYSWPGVLALLVRNRLRGLPQIHRGTLNFYKDPRRGLKAHVLRPVRNILLRLFNAHHYGGSYSKRVLRAAGVPEQVMFFVPYSVDSQFFKMSADDQCEIEASVALRKSLGWDGNARVVLYICQHNWFKGPDIAMEVFAKLYARFPKYRALIVGSGRMTEEMKKIASATLPAGSYHFAGFCPSKETVKYYLTSDIVLFTSRYETWGRAINEAMLCRRPCVVNRMFPAVGGLVENEDNGFVVDNLEPDSYVEAIERYFARSDEAQKVMGENARVRALEMSYENHIGELRQSIEFAATFRQTNWAQSN